MLKKSFWWSRRPQLRLNFDTSMPWLEEEQVCWTKSFLHMNFTISSVHHLVQMCVLCLKNFPDSRDIIYWRKDVTNIMFNKGSDWKYYFNPPCCGLNVDCIVHVLLGRRCNKMTTTYIPLGNMNRMKYGTNNLFNKSWEFFVPFHQASPSFVDITIRENISPTSLIKIYTNQPAVATSEFVWWWWISNKVLDWLALGWCFSVERPECAARPMGGTSFPLQN